MVQGVKYLMCNHEGMSLEIQNPWKCQVIILYVSIIPTPAPMRRGQRLEDSWGAEPLAEMASSRFNE